jgi:hypothetical protein
VDVESPRHVQTRLPGSLRAPPERLDFQLIAGAALAGEETLQAIEARRIVRRNGVHLGFEGAARGGVIVQARPATRAGWRGRCFLGPRCGGQGERHAQNRENRTHTHQEPLSGVARAPMWIIPARKITECPSTQDFVGPPIVARFAVRIPALRSSLETLTSAMNNYCIVRQYGHYPRHRKNPATPLAPARFTPQQEARASAGASSTQFCFVPNPP